MKAVIFLGPSLPLPEARRILDAIYLPPAQQADVVSALKTHKPDVIGIIDGEFLQSLSIWHKEILYAIDHGVPVYGASSMGALRAAETDDFGMIGVGEVYRMYATGELNDDDEVALAHSTEETGYRKFSEPMVNVRLTLRLARDEGVIDEALCQRLISIAKSIYFPHRTFSLIYEKAASEGVPDYVLARVREFVSHNYQDVKRQDAILLLETIRNLPESLPELDQDFTFVNSLFFHALYNRDRTVNHGGSDVSLAAITNYTALHHPNFAELNFEALNRALVRIFADLLDLSVPREAVDEETKRFRLRHGLTSQEKLANWLSGNDLDEAEFEELMHETALCRALHRWLLMRHAVDGSTRFLLNQLRWKNRYEEWASAAAMQEQILRVHYPLFGETDHNGMSMVQLVNDHLRQTDCRMDTNYATWAEEAGFHKILDLKQELVRSKLVREFLEKLDAQLAYVFSEEQIDDPAPSAEEAGA